MKPHKQVRGHIPSRQARSRQARSRQARSSARGRQRSRLRFEQFESRNLLATLIVDDDGGGDFRGIALAIQAAAANDIIQITGGFDRKHTELGIVVSKDLTIEGLADGGPQVIVQAHTSGGVATDRVFEIASGVTAAIDNLKIQYGNTADSGGGIENLGILTVTGSTLSGNTAEFGGGIFNRYGTLTISQSTISGNRADVGGGIFNLGGTLTVSQSSISDNTADTGGGLDNAVSGGNVMIRQSTLSGNTAVESGGGISNRNGALTVSQSTLSGNTAGASGGGINNLNTLTVRQSTLSGNTAGANGGGINNANTLTVSQSTLSGNTADSGGGIFFTGSTTLSNTIVAGNRRTDATASDLEGTNALSSSTHNLIGDASTAGGLTDGDNGNLVGVDLQSVFQSALSDRGGPTQTIVLAAGSPALDAGDNDLIPLDEDDLDGNSDTTEPVPFDQRGNPFARIFNGTVDIGAYERQSFVVTTLNDELDYSNNTLTDGVSLREVIHTANFDPGGITSRPDLIRFAPALNGGTITLSMGELTISDSLTIFGPGAFSANQLAIDADGMSRIFLVDDGDAAEQIEVEIAGLTLTGGDRSSGNGGAIYNREQLTINKSTLSGNTAASGGGIANDFYTSLTIRDSTISGNTATTRRGGGAIQSYGDLTISDSTISGNTAERGGGIMHVVGTGTLTITDTAVSNNTADYGGGIMSFGDATLSQSTVSGNSATVSGGGIVLNRGTLEIHQSTLDGNTAKFGGGISANGELTISQSTISGNTALIGDGISANGELTISQSTISGNLGVGIGISGTLTVNNSTISGNLGVGIDIDISGTVAVNQSTISGHSSSGIANRGTLTVSQSTISGNSFTGIYNYTGFDSMLTLSNTIVAGNSFSDMRGENAESSSAHNLIGDAATAGGLTNGDNGNLVGVDWKTVLANDGTDPTLADKNGPTATIALLPGSPAIDAGANNLIPADEDDLDGDGDKTELLPFDQRWHEFARIVGGTVDIGAYERRSFVVNTLADEFDYSNNTATDGVSLREAIHSANQNATADAITFSAGLNGGTITLNMGELVISDAVTINGPGADLLTIDADAKSRIFVVDDGDGGQQSEVEIAGLTLTGAIPGCGRCRGGAIINHEQLTVRQSTISGNSGRRGSINNKGTLAVNQSTISGNTSFEGGGAIYNENGSTLTVRQSTLSNNTTGYFGGGIYNSGTTTISQSTISGNSADSGGGGIANRGTLTVRQSTLSNNTTGLFGGGIYNSGTTTISQSTISGNSASRYGGGIDNNGTLTVSQSTLSGNTADRGGGIHNIFGNTLTVRGSTISGNSASRYGGGIFINGPTTLSNTIVAGNRRTNATANDLEGNNAESDSAFNLIGDATTAGGLMDGVNGNLVAIDWKTVLANDGNDPTLADNGGPTQTIALRVISPAIDAGDNNLIPLDVDDLDGDSDTTEPMPFDQRGATFDRIVNGSVDIGAYEDVNAAPVLAAIGDKSVDEGSLLTFTVSATDSDTLSFTLDPNAPTGASIHPTTGVFTWTPSEDQGPGAIDITVRVTDDGSPNLDDFETISVQVNDEHPWNNFLNPYDVDADDIVAPLDVLIIVNYLNANGPGLLPVPDSQFAPAPYLDVNADGSVAPIDVLQVINEINSSVGNAEGEAPASRHTPTEYRPTIFPYLEPKTQVSRPQVAKDISTTASSAESTLSSRREGPFVRKSGTEVKFRRASEDENPDFESVLDEIADDVSKALFG